MELDYGYGRNPGLALIQKKAAVSYSNHDFKPNQSA